MTTSITSQVLLTLPEFRVSVNSDRNLSTMTNPKMILFFATGFVYFKCLGAENITKLFQDFPDAYKKLKKDMHTIKSITNCDVLLS